MMILHYQQYTSPEILNELIKLMENEVLRQMLVHIHEVTCFPVLTDETTDVANHGTAFTLNPLGHEYI